MKILKQLSDIKCCIIRIRVATTKENRREGKKKKTRNKLSSCTNKHDCGWQIVHKRSQQLALYYFKYNNKKT